MQPQAISGRCKAEVFVTQLIIAATVKGGRSVSFVSAEVLGAMPRVQRYNFAKDSLYNILNFMPAKTNCFAMFCLRTAECQRGGVTISPGEVIIYRLGLRRKVCLKVQIHSCKHRTMSRMHHYAMRWLFSQIHSTSSGGVFSRIRLRGSCEAPESLGAQAC